MNIIKYDKVVAIAAPVNEYNGINTRFNNIFDINPAADETIRYLILSLKYEATLRFVNSP